MEKNIDDIINIPNSTKIVNLNSLEKYSTNHPEEFAEFMREHSSDLIKGCKVSEAVREYIDRLDDSEHYLIRENEFNIILDALRNDGFED